MLDAARSMPLSASVMVNRDEFGEILQDAIDGLPEELRAGALAAEGARRGARAGRSTRPSRIIDVARVRAERMVERTEVVREARRTAEEIVDQRRAPRRRRCATRPRTTSTASSPLRGRARPHDAAGAEGPGAALGPRAGAEDLLGPDADEAEQAFFDQDDGLGSDQDDG